MMHRFASKRIEKLDQNQSVMSAGKISWNSSNHHAEIRNKIVNLDILRQNGSKIRSKSIDNVCWKIKFVKWLKLSCRNNK